MNLGILQIFLFGFCMSLIILGCEQKKPIVEESLIVRLKMSVYKDDSLQLFYLLNADDSYSEELSIKKFVKGLNSIQNIEFILPPRVKPKNLRIDFGDKKNYHDSIGLYNVSLIYRNHKLSAKDGEYKQWFVTNEDIYFDSDSLLYRFKSKQHSFDPQIRGNELFNKKIVKLFTPDIYERRTH
ncbi:hypothetical protein [Empedobacter brevis]|uniref:hypothetical protein n=1 Tax=Empedobacter brevis TaxID=247 RepID=UPI003341373C